MRVQDNVALQFAQERACARTCPLLIIYNLIPQYLGGGDLQLWFKSCALKELEKKCETLNVAFHVIVDSTHTQTPQKILEILALVNASELITDMSPLRESRNETMLVAKKCLCPFWVVDAHNIVPITVVSEKKEYAAYTIRPKIYRHLSEFMKDGVDANLKTIRHPYPISKKIITFLQSQNTWKEDISQLSQRSVEWIAPGEDSAQKALADFIENRLSRYAYDRNNALAHGQSDLSPYLHYGMISAQRIAHEIVRVTKIPIIDLMSSSRNKAKITPNLPRTLEDHAGAFLEELIIRRELSDNFCWYTPDYDSFEAFPAWAQDTLSRHAKDSRSYTYDLKTFEEGKTHDSLWNACQLEMVRSGKMHGYMRMYWAKKILEWTTSPHEALAFAVYLNDQYELDGRDPNGYAGIAWSIGGVHDRPWFERTIFGQIRYMSESGAKKNFDTKAYIELHLSPRQGLNL